MKILGIDPGLEGALTLINTVTRTLHVRAMPTWKRVTDSTSKTLIDEDAVTSIVAGWQPDEAWAEDVWSSEQMGVVSSFSFGEGKGILKGVLAASGLRREQRFWVAPATWKGQLRISADKPIAKKQAHLLFPDCKKLLSSADKAESALIALYGLLTNHPALVKTSFPLRPGA